MNGPVVELSLTESFAKHKRNLLFVCSIVAILAVASPKGVKLPGGTGDPVPAAVAYFFLLCVLVYFSASYWVESLAMDARNNGGTAGKVSDRKSEIEVISDRIMLSVRPLEIKIEQLFSNIQHAEGDIKRISGQFNFSLAEQASSSFSSKIEELTQLIDVFVNKDDPHGLQNNVGSLRTHVHNLDAKIGALVKSVDTGVNGMVTGIDGLKSTQDKILVKIKDVEDDMEDLVNKLGSISKNIIRPQRLGYAVLEKGVPSILALAAALVCIDGVLFQSSIVEALLSHVPAIAEAKSLDAQSGSQINGKP